MFSSHDHYEACYTKPEDQPFASEKTWTVRHFFAHVQHGTLNLVRNETQVPKY